MKEKNKGITLIALIITIIIMLILVAVSIQMVINTGLFEAAKNAGKKTEEAYRNEANLGEKVTVGGKEYNSVEEYVAKLAGIKANGSWDGTINTPKLSSDMKAIVFNEDGTESEPETNAEWYNYDDHKWANAKTEDGSYWVWIPRFEYKITAPVDDAAAAGTIDVRFISTATKEGSAGYTTLDGITTSSDGYIIHPAFTNKPEVGGWDSELSGFWVAKYEMSMEGKTDSGDWTPLVPTVGTSNTAISGNVGTTNTITAYNATVSEDKQKTTSVTDGTDTYTSIRAVSKPGVSSWRNITISNCYENAYNYDRSKESHLMKNSEWGAVAYLTHSSKERNGTEVSKNSTGYVSAAGGDSTSTTGNKTGVYDLSGGSAEYVAAFNDAYSGDRYSTTNTEVCSCTGKNMGATGIAKGESNKYLTAYRNSTGYSYIGENASYNSFEAFENAGMKVSITGDAIKEVWKSADRSWHNDCAFFANSDKPFFWRSGYYYSYEDAGVFFSKGGFGGRDFGCSFRVVCSL